MNKITVEFKAVKIKVQVEGLRLEGLEEMVFEIRQELGKAAFENALRQYDKVLAKSRTQGELKNKGKKTKYLQTKVGEIQYKRRIYKEKKTKKIRYLLDEALGIGRNQRMSLKIAQLLGVLASSYPYRGVRDSIEKMIGIKWSHEAIRQNIIAEGKRIEEKEVREYQKVKNLGYEMPEEIPEVVYNETDATYIRKQNKGKRKGRGKRRHLEVKAGIGYTGKESRYKEGSKKAKKLSQRIIYAEIRAKRDEFLDRFSCINERVFGRSQARKSYLGGDGDIWIQKGKEEYFSSAEYILCPFHLFRNLRRAIPGKKRIHVRLKKLLEKPQIDKVLTDLERMRRMVRNDKMKERIHEYYVYIRNNREGIENSMRIRIDKTIESAGAVEANIDKVIAHRFKGRGMSWSEDGAQSLLKIRQTIINGQWDDWWYNKRNKRIEIKAILKEPLTATKMNRKREIPPFIEAELPCFRGPDQSKPWVGILRELSRMRQLS